MELRSLGTHDGSFHADEVTACSLLLLFDLIDQDKVHRTRDPKILNKCDFVCDVGGIYDATKRRFDHHQVDYQGAMSSAGMILLYLKDQKFIEPHLYDYFHKGLIMGVDAHDNGVAKLEPGIASFSQVVSNFLPIEYDSSTEEMDKAFFRAVDFVTGHLDRLKKRYLYTIDCRTSVKKAMVPGSNALIFEESLPWIENFFDLGGELHPAQFVIMPAGSHWKLRGIPPSLAERMKVRQPLPEAWAGLHEENLKKISGIKGAVFCHKGRFISIWETKEDALKALHIALEKK
ncbi:MAG: hypothetical protein COT85_03910 [Chlamydiae bacterium CG10_big_fil_rev_8_21_14_0_10_42_34]|nr:MAG: hypothetical protein COT85_03910 [Chlamydiae bacterium CG10_big_fil_rev_8_21_14_0_10_42_34]